VRVHFPPTGAPKEAFLTFWDKYGRLVADIFYLPEVLQGQVGGSGGDADDGDEDSAIAAAASVVRPRTF
jgi:hypothetical protein